MDVEEGRRQGLDLPDPTPEPEDGDSDETEPWGVKRPGRKLRHRLRLYHELLDGLGYNRDRDERSES